MSVRIIADDSKYRSCRYAYALFISPEAIAKVIKNKTVVLYANEAPLPSATSVSIFGAPCTKLLKPLVKNRLLISMTESASSIS